MRGATSLVTKSSDCGDCSRSCVTPFAPVESHSIKKLEPLSAFTRSVALQEVDGTMARTQARLEGGSP